MNYKRKFVLTYNLAIFDSYHIDGRKEFKSVGMKTAGLLFQEMFNKCSPYKVESKIFYPADKEFKTPNLDLFDAVTWTGSSLTIMETYKPEINSQTKFIKQIQRAKLPQFGSCWGIQIATVLSGGECKINPKGREMGIGRKIIITEKGKYHPMYIGKPEVFDAYVSHNDEVYSLGRSLIKLSGNSWSQIQAASTDDLSSFWAVQYHPEFNLHEMSRLISSRRKKLMELGFFKTEDVLFQLIDDMERLFLDPNRVDLAWKLGIDNDILDQNIRQIEVKNWIENIVLPEIKKKQLKEKKTTLNKKSTQSVFALDVDGVLNRGDTIIPGAKVFLILLIL